MVSFATHQQLVREHGLMLVVDAIGDLSDALTQRLILHLGLISL